MYIEGFFYKYNKYNSSTPVHNIVAVTTSHGNYTRNMRHKVFTRTKIMIQQTSSNTLFALKAGMGGQDFKYVHHFCQMQFALIFGLAQLANSETLLIQDDGATLSG